MRCPDCSVNRSFDRSFDRCRIKPSSLAFLLVAICMTGFIRSPALGQGFASRLNLRGNSAPVVSDNFVVYAPDPILARKVSAEAERFRKELAIQWIGSELKPWVQKCPITVNLGLHAGGETSFAFVTDRSGRGKPIDWKMRIFGPVDRILDAVLPHEVTHTIFATHFGRPLPRWADEGACTTVEHYSERKKNHQMLMNFLHAQPSRGLPFNRMFTMRDYPHDILPLYAQGYSVAKFLILHKGRRHFLDYISRGLENENRVPALQAWDLATKEFYDYKNLSVLQVTWLDWVRKGSSEAAFQQSDDTPVFTVASAQPANQGTANGAIDSQVIKQPVFPKAKTSSAVGTFTSSNSNSWYAQQMGKRSNERVAAARHDVSPIKARKVTADERPNKNTSGIEDASLPKEYQVSPDTIWR